MSKGFLSDPLGKLFDPRMLREAAAGMAGGGATGAVYTGLIGLVKINRTQKDANGNPIKDESGKVVKAKEFFFDKPWKRVLLAAGLGLGGGALLWQKEREASKGVMYSASGMIGAEIADWIVRKVQSSKAGDSAGDGATAGFGEDREAEAALSNLLGTRGLRALPEEQEIAGLASSTSVETERMVNGRQLAGAEAIEVEDGPGLGSWIGAVG